MIELWASRICPDLLMTKASTILDNVDVSVIGLKSLSNTVTEMSSSFQARRHLHSEKEKFKISAIGAASVTANSLSIT